MTTPGAAAASPPSSSQATQPADDSLLYLHLRINALRALLVGTAPENSASNSVAPSDPALLRRSLAALESFDELARPHKAIRTFFAGYNANRHLLVPSAQLPPSLSLLAADATANTHATYAQTLEPAEDHGAPPREGPEGTTSASESALLIPPLTKAALLLDAEPQLRAFERHMRECQTLDERGVASAEGLEEHATMRPQLNERRAALDSLHATYDDLEEQLLAQLDRYESMVDGISELHIAWDRSLTELERSVAQLERRRAIDAADA